MSDAFGPYAFALTKDEFFVYAHEVGRRQLAQIDAKAWRLSIFAMLAVGAVLGGLAASGVADRATLATGLLASAGAILMGRFMIRRQIGRAQTLAIEALAKEGAFATPVSLAVEPTSLVLDMGGRSDRRAFSELREVARFGGLIVFWFGINDGVALPERTLETPQTADAIIAQARGSIDWLTGKTG